MTNVEKATNAMMAAWAELYQYSMRDAVDLIELVYQCDRQQAEEFVFAVEQVNAANVPVERRRFDDESHRASHKLLLKNRELEKKNEELKKQLIESQKKIINSVSITEK